MAASALEEAEESPPFAEKYDVERVIGRGGMGTVFEARHLRLGHRVAIKVLGEDLRRHPELVARFEREARAAGALSSPHAVKVFDIDQTDDGTPFMVMELLTGRDLEHLVQHDGAQPIGASARWIIEACDAIAEAHRLGIVHRDIKPSNLFLSRDTGSIKVLDFGIAKRVAAKEASITLGVEPLGTPQYMSPEQVRCAKDVDARSDIWSLGVTLYEIVCARPPFDHDVPQACIAAIVADPIPDPRAFRPDLPGELAAILMRALAKDPAERFQSVDELVLALAPFAEASPTDRSWRVIDSARRAVAATRTTVARHVVLEAARRESPDGPALRSEETVPPAVSRARREATRGKGSRSRLALVGAAVLGLASLVATPRCVGARLEALSSPIVAAPPHAGEGLANAATLTAPAAPAPSIGEQELAPPEASELGPWR
ncbi:MAG: serine/threonine protein kinase, partial [Labilithrix sp.]|nr:serine/threonine protein kinase [Labilithrix sp.]